MSITYDTLEVSVKDIVLDPALQIRKEMSKETIRNYEMAYRNQTVLPPLLVTTRPGKFPGADVYILLNGFHRLEALRNIRQEKILVKIVVTAESTTPHELRWIGGSENLANGLPLKGKDVRELFRAFVRAKQHRRGHGFKSYRDIARELVFVTHQTVSNWMKMDFPSVFRAMGRTGQAIDNKAEGTGQRVVDVPDLSMREFALFHHDLLKRAQDSENDERWEIRQRLQQLIEEFDEVAPCTEPAF